MLKNLPKNFDEQKFLEKSRKRFEKAWYFNQENRENGLDDLKFIAGDQWDEQVAAERKEKLKPILTFNLLDKFVSNVLGDQMQNRPQIKFRPFKSGASQSVAEIFEGITRHIEQNGSGGVNAYDTGFKGSLSNGWGNWRINLEHNEDDNFNRDIVIKRINNPMSVFWDHEAQNIDKSDAKHCWVTEWISKEDFEEKYPGFQSNGFSFPGSTSNAIWFNGDQVLIAEYFWVDIEKEELLLFSDGKSLLKGILDAEDIKELKLNGIEVVDTRDVEIRTIKQVIMSGSNILKGINEWPGKFIPIVECTGKEIWIENKRILKSLIRDGKDAQRAYNFWKSIIAEILSLAPKAQFIGPEGAFAGHEKEWANANNSNAGYLVYNDDAPAAPHREPMVTVPTGYSQEAAVSKVDTQETTGVFDAGLGNRSNERSGVAIQARQQAGDTSVFVFFNNFVQSLRHTGLILADLIPKIYNTERVLRVVDSDNQSTFKPVNGAVMDIDEDVANDTDNDQNQENDPINDLTKGRYDVFVDVGPFFASMRMHAVDTLMKLVQTAPQLAPLTLDLIAKNLDFPGARELKDRIEQATKQAQQQPVDQTPAGQ